MAEAALSALRIDTLNSLVLPLNEEKIHFFNLTESKPDCSSAFNVVFGGVGGRLPYIPLSIMRASEDSDQRICLTFPYLLIADAYRSESFVLTCEALQARDRILSPLFVENRSTIWRSLPSGVDDGVVTVGAMKVTVERKATRCIEVFRQSSPTEKDQPERSFHCHDSMFPKGLYKFPKFTINVGTYGVVHDGPDDTPAFVLKDESQGVHAIVRADVQGQLDGKNTTPALRLYRDDRFLQIWCHIWCSEGVICRHPDGRPSVAIFDRAVRFTSFVVDWVLPEDAPPGVLCHIEYYCDNLALARSQDGAVRITPGLSVPVTFFIDTRTVDSKRWFFFMQEHALLSDKLYRIHCEHDKEAKTCSLVACSKAHYQATYEPVPEPRMFALPDMSFAFSDICNWVNP